ncbi:MAG: protein FxsA [Micromonosporaceae bacterium]|jgi:UPF0716 protein FxsA|nr:protein FxsA [Micromonosporaceae bacterium]
MTRRAPLAGLAAIAIIVIEIAVFVGVVKLVGLLGAIGGIVALSLVGAWLVPRQGMRAWRRFRHAARAGTPPGGQATDGLIGLIGALLLAVPGFVTALIGAALLTPPLRRYARGRLDRFVQRRMSALMAGDLFGPRRVRVRRTRSGYQPADPVPDRPARDTRPAAIDAEIVEDG